MRTLSSELGPHAEDIAECPRIYADANIPAGLIAFMRTRLGWDVLFVLEDPDLRRARDREHYRLARELHRTLVTLDRDYFDDKAFPLEESGGVIVLSAPDERALAAVLQRVDRIIFRSRSRKRRLRAGRQPAPPLLGRKLQVATDWPPRTPRQRARRPGDQARRR